MKDEGPKNKQQDTADIEDVEEKSPEVVPPKMSPDLKKDEIVVNEQDQNKVINEREDIGEEEEK